MRALSILFLGFCLACKSRLPKSEPSESPSPASTAEISPAAERRIPAVATPPPSIKNPTLPRSLPAPAWVSEWVGRQTYRGYYLYGRQCLAFHEEGGYDIYGLRGAREGGRGWVRVVAWESKERLTSAWRGDADAQTAGEELYVGGASGAVYRVEGEAVKKVCEIEGAVALLKGGDFEPERPGGELLVFMAAGGIYRAADEPERIAGTRAPVVGAEVFRERGRDVVMVAAGNRLGVLRQDGGRYTMRTIYRHAAELASLTAGPWQRQGEPVFYVAGRDGAVLRVAHRGRTEWRIDEVYRAAAGELCVAAGPLGRDPAGETVALGGPDRGLTLLIRDPDGGYRTEAVAPSLRPRHIAVVEVDAGNETREIACLFPTGVVILSR